MAYSDTRELKENSRIDALVAFLNKHSIWLPRPHGDWRLCDPVRGMPAGLPTLHGTLHATNGTLGIVLLDSTGEPEIVHVTSFEEDEPVAEGRKTRPSRAEQLLERYGI